MNQLNKNKFIDNLNCSFLVKKKLHNQEDMEHFPEQSFSPWEIQLFDEKCTKYLKQPPQIKNKTNQRQFNDTFIKKIDNKSTKGYFVNRSRILSKSRTKNNNELCHLKKTHQSLHFDAVFQTGPTKQQKQFARRQTFHTIINFAKKRKSLKQKIQRTKKLLQKNQKTRSTQALKKNEKQKQIDAQLQKLLQLHKNSSQFNLTHFSNSAILSCSTPALDWFFQTKKSISLNCRGRNAQISVHKQMRKKASQTDLQKTSNFLDSRSNLMSLKKKVYNRTFYKSPKYERSMNLPKIQILDWQKPQL